MQESPSNCSTVCGALPPLVTLGTAPWLAAAACAPAEKASSPAEGLASHGACDSVPQSACSSTASTTAAVQQARRSVTLRASRSASGQLHFVIGQNPHSGPSRSASAGGWYAADDEAPPPPPWLPGSQYVLSSVYGTLSSSSKGLLLLCCRAGRNMGQPRSRVQ